MATAVTLPSSRMVVDEGMRDLVLDQLGIEHTD